MHKSPVTYLLASLGMVCALFFSSVLPVEAQGRGQDFTPPPEDQTPITPPEAGDGQVSEPETTVKEGCWCFAGGMEENVSAIDSLYDDPKSCANASGTYDVVNGDLLTECTWHPKKSVAPATTPLPTAPTVLEKLLLPAGISDLNHLGTTSLPGLIGRFLRVLMGVVGSIALAVMVYAGVMWMTSFGSDRVEKAKEMLMWGAFGVIVIFSSYAIITFLFDVF